ncbi:glyoxalase superfamily protein [Parvularcula marina]|uniref:Glyoxalase-related protein domain-containing protein n=1 Tax=Parvularcula marina TaxID=2292771 RepID=A0A371RI94_9PROT|nr:glyoxalase superfamily protein [Parvularcula marina]RFB05179.1 hypothetical protein DX908_07880 [Parvularcula marina]
MTENLSIPSLEALKRQAKNLRAALASEGDFISHSEALELIARQYGMRDWNTLHARAGNRPDPPSFQPGRRVSGDYLGQPFAGEIIAVHNMGEQGVRLTLHFDEPVDVVTFDSFSAYRQRVTKFVRPDGISPERTSGGVPHLSVKTVS